MWRWRSYARSSCPHPDSPLHHRAGARMPRSPHSDGLHSRDHWEGWEVKRYPANSCLKFLCFCITILFISNESWGYLQTLGGALMGPSTEEAGGSAGGRHSPWWASTKSGAGAAIFGKGCDPIAGRCVVGAGGRDGPESGGREVSPVELFLWVAGGGCLWSSLPRLWKTSSRRDKETLDENGA